MMTDEPAAVWECDTRFTTNNPLTARMQQTLKEQGTLSGFLVEDDDTVRWTTRVLATDPAQAVGQAASELRKAFEVGGLSRHDFVIIESTAVRH